MSDEPTTYGELFPLDSQWDMIEWKSVASHLVASPNPDLDCGGVDPDSGYVCTRPTGHDSYHVAHGGTGEIEGDGVYAVWDDTRGIYRDPDAVQPHITAGVNRRGYFVHHKSPEGPRTYACADRSGLEACIYHLTGRLLDTFVVDARGLPQVPDCAIADGCHIYSFMVGPTEVIKPKTETNEAASTEETTGV